MKRTMHKTIIGLVAIVAMMLASEARASITVSGELLYTDVPGSYSGPTTIDRITFDVTAGTTINFDTLAWELLWNGSYYGGVDLNGDGEFTVVDTQLRLFNSSNVGINGNDDGPVGSDGSITGLDSNFSHTFTTGGTYFLTVGTLYYTDAEALAGYEPDNGHVGKYYNAQNATYYGIGSPVFVEDHADWQVTLNNSGGTISNVHVQTNQSAVPEPTALLIWSSLGLVGLVSGRRRRI